MDLSRRDVLGIGGAGVLLASAPKALPGTEQARPRAPALPDWMMREIRLAKARFAEWKGNDEALVFPTVSDIHAGTTALRDPPNWSDAMVHQYALDEAAKAFGADFVADLGDIGIDRNRVTWKDEPLEFGNAVLDCQKRVYDAFSTPALHLVGNHDLGNVLWHHSSDHYFRTFNAPLTGLPGFLYVGEGYGRWDFPRKMTRVVFLNTSEMNVGNTGGAHWVGMTRKQVEFLDRSLAELGRGWTAVVLSHANLHPYLGLWRSETASRASAGFADALDVLKRHAGAGRIRLAGVIAGHSHLDADVKENGVQHVIVQSYGLNGPDHLRPMYRYNRVNTAKSMLVDVVAVKPYRSQMKIFRIGCGGEACDRSFPSRCHGAKAFSASGASVRIVSASYPKPLVFRLAPDDFVHAEPATSWTRDGVRFVWIDNAAHDVEDSQGDFFRRETAKGEGVVLLLAKPLFMPGMSEADAPCANPASSRKHEWRTHAFRESVFLYTPNVLGVFAPASGRSFVAADNGRHQYAFERGMALDVAIN